MKAYSQLVEQLETTLSVFPFLMLIAVIISLSLNPSLKGKKQIITRILAICSFIAFMSYVIITMVFFGEELPFIAKLISELIAICFGFLFIIVPIFDIIHKTNHFMYFINGIIKYCSMKDIADDKKDKIEQMREKLLNANQKELDTAKQKEQSEIDRLKNKFENL